MKSHTNNAAPLPVLTFSLGSQPLADALLCLGVLTPVFRVLAGDESVDDIARSLVTR